MTARRLVRRAGARRAAAALLPALLAACAAAHRPKATVASLAGDGARLRGEYRTTVDSVVERLARRAAARGDNTLDVLLLSGGGQNGAYGTGFLRGWRERPGEPMPRFDLVTGISTGALQAPFALLGDAASLDTLTALYRDAADRIAPGIDWLFWLRRTGGLVKATRLERTIDQVLDARLQARLGAEFALGRQIAVGTTDLDLGTGRLWDMARLLGRGAPGLDSARRVLRAATAIPGIFPPVVLDGHVHGDGGVIANLLPVLDLAAYEALAARLRERGVAGPVTVRVWAVDNLWTHVPLAVTDPASRRGVNRRANALLFWAQQPQLADRLATLARAVTAGVPGVRMEFRVTAVPAALSQERAASKLFDRGFMARLDSLGYARARGAAPWDSVASVFERPVR